MKIEIYTGVKIDTSNKKLQCGYVIARENDILLRSGRAVTSSSSLYKMKGLGGEIFAIQEACLTAIKYRPDEIVIHYQHAGIKQLFDDEIESRRTPLKQFKSLMADKIESVCPVSLEKIDVQNRPDFSLLAEQKASEVKQLKTLF